VKCDLLEVVMLRFKHFHFYSCSMSVPQGGGERLCSTVWMENWRTACLSSKPLERWTVGQQGELLGS